jgi:hypothetical protein
MNRLSLFDQQWTRFPIRVKVTMRRPPPLGAAADPKKPKLLKSVHGDGYVFTANVSRPGVQKN